MSGDHVLRTRSGPDYEVENQATALLMKDRKDRGIKGVRVNAEEYNWLTDWQLESRYGHETYTSVGSPDPNIVSGMFFRAYNPFFGKRPKRSDAPAG